MGYAEALEKAKKVKFVIFDIHGILTTIPSSTRRTA